MNHLVYLDAQAGELEKILSGVKTMLVQEFDPTHTPVHPIRPGDSLYLLKNTEERTLHVKATVIRVQTVANDPDEDLSQILKEMQPKLQMTEDQFNRWSVMPHVLLVEFGSAQKINMVQIASHKITDRSGWIAFEDFSSIL
jgi:hypothetical protein